MKYSVPISWYLSSYVFTGIVTAILVWGFLHFENVPMWVLILMSLLIVATWLAPSTTFGRTLIIDDQGIRQNVVFEKWELKWDEIIDWSVVKTKVIDSDSGHKWENHIFIKEKNNRVVSVNQWFLQKNRIQEIKSVLLEKTGNPKDVQSPIVPQLYRGCETEWI